MKRHQIHIHTSKPGKTWASCSTCGLSSKQGTKVSAEAWMAKHQEDVQRCVSEIKTFAVAGPIGCGLWSTTFASSPLGRWSNKVCQRIMCASAIMDSSVRCWKRGSFLELVIWAVFEFAGLSVQPDSPDNGSIR